MDSFSEYILTASKYVLIILSLAVIVRCIRSMLSESYESEVWACLRWRGEELPITHWENLVGRGLSADLRIASPSVSRVHAVITRSERGEWSIYDVFSKGGVWVNGVKIGASGVRLDHGDVINIGGEKLRFLMLSSVERETIESGRTAVGKRVSPALTLLELSVFQLFLLLQHAVSAQSEDLPVIALSFAALIALEWCCYYAMRIIDKSGFEIETLAFFLTSLGLSVAASSAPEELTKQVLLTVAAVLLFLLSGWWLRSLRRVMAMRWFAAVLAIALVAVNVAVSDVVLGAKNWLEFGGFSFQPSEFVKVLYVYVGASTLDRLYRKRNLYSFIAFSALCVIAMALIGDFGTALIFFATFLVISYLRSGSIATVLLAVSAAGLAGALAVSAKPYIAERFATWGHAWDDVYDAGFQQTRAMSAAASGGLYGKGAGRGWLTEIFAADTDMVFAVVCEEQGLIIGCLMVLAVLALALFAVRSARHGRSAYYSIASCAAMSMLLVQLALNVFGSLDLLPFTGVTFPFVSRGGSSLICCWIMMSFIKGADNRRGASFAVKPPAGNDEPDPADDEALSDMDMYYDPSGGGYYSPGAEDEEGPVI